MLTDFQEGRAGLPLTPGRPVQLPAPQPLTLTTRPPNRPGLWLLLLGGEECPCYLGPFTCAADVHDRAGLVWALAAKVGATHYEVCE